MRRSNLGPVLYLNGSFREITLETAHLQRRSAFRTFIHILQTHLRRITDHLLSPSTFDWTMRVIEAVVLERDELGRHAVRISGFCWVAGVLSPCGF